MPVLGLSSKEATRRLMRLFEVHEYWTTERLVAQMAGDAKRDADAERMQHVTLSEAAALRRWVKP